MASRTDAVARPHQLFLTGDQIYADLMPAVMQHVVTGLAKTLIGQVEQLPTKFARPDGNNSVNLLPCDLATFPAGMRKNLANHDARFSTDDGQNHCLAFGEFCASHLLAWSNELWPEPLPGVTEVFPAPADPMPPIWAL